MFCTLKAGIETKENARMKREFVILKETSGVWQRRKLDEKEGNNVYIYTHRYYNISKSSAI